MVSNKLKEMVEKLKSQQPKAAAPTEPVAKADQPGVEQPTEAPQEVVEAPKEEKQLTQEQVQQMISDRVVGLRDDGTFRYEILEEINKVSTELNLLNEILVKVLGKIQ